MNRYRVLVAPGSVVAYFEDARQPFGAREIQLEAERSGLLRTVELSAHSAEDACTSVRVAHSLDVLNPRQRMRAMVLSVECLPVPVKL